MMKKMNVEVDHQRVENIRKTQTNIQGSEKEVIPSVTMRKKTPIEYQSYVTEEIHLKTVRIASQRTHLTTNHPMTMILTIVENILRQISRRIKKQNRKSISNHAITRRINANDIIHRMKMKNITRKRQKRVNVHDPDPGIEDNCF